MENEGANTAAGDPLADLRADLARHGEITAAALADRLQADQGRRWRAGRGVPAETYLEVHPQARDHPDLIVELILGEILLRRERGERPDPAEYIRRFPDLSGVLSGHLELDRLLGADEDTLSLGAAPHSGLTTVGGSGTTADLGSFGPSGVAEAGDPPANGLARGDSVRYFGDYEIRKELGRGGMGVVYEARQVSLNRPVALKMIRSGILADDDELRRFRNEAEAIALLDHPGLVPIHEVGQHDGQHYFSMKLVPGGSLSPLPDRYRSDPKAAATLAAEAAEAVAHAHARGVLHRDLKPANILMDAEGHPHVADFGLAKRVATDVETTASGAILGTPAYMAPEQATGRRGAITTATDVYGLGAILYALLTGRAPFGGHDAIETLDAVRTRPPEPPRRLNPRVPRDLETICLKCLEKDARRRYASAQALADELRAWLESRPIAGRRVGPIERGWLWCRRRPAVAALTAAVVLATVIGTATVIVVQARANADLARSRADVQARYDLAVDAIKMFHTGVSEDFLLKEEKFKELRDRLLRAAAGFYGKLGAMLGKGTDLASRRALASANFELAELTARIGRTEDALSAHRAVLESRRRLATEPGAGAAATAEVGRSLTAVATLLESAGQTDEALATLREAEALLAGHAPESPEARAALATCRTRLGNVLSAIGRDEAAQESYRQARSDQEAMAAAAGTANEARRDLAETVFGIASLLSRTGKPEEAEAEHRAALAIHRKLAADNPARSEFRCGLATSHSDLGALLGRMGKPEAAEAEFRAALAIFQKLADDNPAVSHYSGRLAGIHTNLGAQLSVMGKPAEADYRAAMAIFHELADDNPAVSEFRKGLATSHANLGALLTGMGKPAEAVTEYRAAIPILQKLVADNPAVPEFRYLLALNHTHLGGLLLRRMRKHAEAEIEYRAALANWRKLSDVNPTVTEFRKGLATGHNELGFLLSLTWKPAESETEFRDAIATFQALVDDNPAASEFRSGLANGHVNLGGLLRGMEKPAEALVEYRAATAIFQKLVDDDPASSDFRSRLAESHINVGGLLIQTRKPADAEAEYRAALAIFHELAETDPTISRYRSIRAITHYYVGNFREFANDRDGAIEQYQEAARLDGEDRHLGAAIFTLARLLGDAGRHHEGIAVYRRMIAIDASEPRGPSGLAGALIRAGRPAEAVGAGRDAVRLLERRAAAEPGKVEHRHDLAGVLLTLGDALRAAGPAGEACAAYDRAVAIREALIKEHPNDPKYRSHLAWSLSRRSLTRGDLGDPAGVAADVRRSLALYDGLPSRSGEEWFQTACVHAALAGLAGSDRPSSHADRAASETETAMALLFKAAGMGYRDRDAYRTEAALDGLRDRDDFKALMMDLAMPSDPFAAGG